MKKAFRIFKRDILRLLHNKVALIVMAGVCVLPSLYAWFNIAANMDPYSNTRGIKVAVANSDTEAKSGKITLNAGKSITDNLKKNDQLGWVFVNPKQAVEGVRAGKYYAAIVIDKNFSSSLLSIISGTPKTPRLDYYINEKKNAIAPKITDAGADTVQQEINDTFSAVAAQTISKLIQTSVAQISGDVDSMDQDVMDMLSKVQTNLGQYERVLNHFKSTAEDGAGQIQNAKSILDSVTEVANRGSENFSNAAVLLNKSRDGIGEFSSAYTQELSEEETRLNDIYNALSNSLGSLKSQARDIQSAMKSGADSAGGLIDKNNDVIKKLQEMDGGLPEDVSSLMDEQSQKLQALGEEYAGLLKSLGEGGTDMDAAINTAEAAQKELEQLISQGRQSLRGYRENLEKTLVPKLSQSLDAFSALNGSLSASMDNVSASALQLKTVLDQLGGSLLDSAEALDKTGEAVKDMSGQISRVRTDLQTLESSNTYKKFVSLKGLDADSIAKYMASPVVIQSKILYSVKNYGSSMTPFYTNLALWVGGIVLISILKLEVDRDKTVRHFATISAFFGRWLLFMVLGMTQGLIVCLGDLWLLKVQCIHPAAFVLTGMFCSFVYVNIIYALAIAFKHIGKALCVLLVILQIPGSAGTYPIEMTPVFFQKLHPLLPFTYGINAMRETIAGMYGNHLGENLLLLGIYLPIALLIGLGLRSLLLNVNYLFDRRLSETDLMLCETQGTENEKTRLSLAIKTLLRDKDMREEMISRAAAFESGYKKRIRIGFLAILILPAVFLILMFSLESRIVFLVLWIVSIIAISVYLIWLEYLHERLKRQIELGNLTKEELLDAMEGGDEE